MKASRGDHVRHKFPAYGVWNGVVIAMKDSGEGCWVKWEDGSTTALSQRAFEKGVLKLG